MSVIIAAFIAGGAAIIVQLWWLFWLSVAMVALSVPTGKLLRIMDDTMTVETPADRRPVAADQGSAADPGVRLD